MPSDKKQEHLASLIISIIILIIVIILIIIVCCGYTNNNTNQPSPYIQNPGAAVAAAYQYGKNNFQNNGCGINTNTSTCYDYNSALGLPYVYCNGANNSWYGETLNATKYRFK
jgi:hypothetical protein